jgi:hypothetical protein
MGLLLLQLVTLVLLFLFVQLSGVLRMTPMGLLLLRRLPQNFVLLL